jgi:hypothetical protein
VSATHETPTPGKPLRLLPWTTPEGKACYLSTDGEDSKLSLLADDIEAAQLDSGEQVLAGAKAVLADPKAGERAVRFALTRAAESLEDVLRVAASRGGRILGTGAVHGAKCRDSPAFRPCSRRVAGTERPLALPLAACGTEPRLSRSRAFPVSRCRR